MAYNVVVCLGLRGFGEGYVEFFNSFLNVDLAEQSGSERARSLQGVAEEGRCLHHGSISF